ncbi:MULTISPECIES: hypothetical protein [Thermocrispum]|jgi:hypothetical protein|uniref:hypothetical protein n=1 Tax=Thermocrispum TaxID=37924 RepID=UPI00042096B5|nr:MULTISPECIES: hypothetical protein [Thermocrispum]
MTGGGAEPGEQLNHRERATLRAVARGGAEITLSAEPDLFIDGLACCDQITVRRLAHRGLIAPGRPGAAGERVPAEITPAGRAALGPIPHSGRAA